MASLILNMLYVLSYAKGLQGVGLGREQKFGKYVKKN